MIRFHFYAHVSVDVAITAYEPETVTCERVCASTVTAAGQRGAAGSASRFVCPVRASITSTFTVRAASHRLGRDWGKFRLLLTEIAPRVLQSQTLTLLNLKRLYS